MIRDQIISQTLKDLGVTPGNQGYYYLREAISLAMDDMSVVHKIVKVIYSHVAKCYNTTPARVERCMRHSIECAWSIPNVPHQAQLFRGTISAKTGKPTNGEFIATVADFLSLSYGGKHGSQ